MEEQLPERRIDCPACAAQWDGKYKQVGTSEVCRCARCGLLFCIPDHLTSADYDEVYTNEYGEYFQSLDATRDWEEFASHPTYRPFFLNVLHRGGAQLLDVGCGVGRFCRAAHAKGWNVTGIDVSRLAIERGQRAVPFSMIIGSIEDIVRDGLTFDVISAFEVLEHIFDVTAFLGNVRSALKPGGHFFCTVPNIESETVRSSNRKDWVPPIHVLFFTEKALQELLQRYGFRDVRTGVIWVNEPPLSPVLELVKYWVRRGLRRMPKPDPLGIWGYGTISPE